METLAARCLRGVRAVLRAARERPHDGAVQALAARVYARLHAVPCALVAVLLRDADAAQLLRVERATHAQGARIATEAHWRALCLRDHGAAHKTAPDATWRMTYEACRRAAALAAEEERLADALDELRDERLAAAGSGASPTPRARLVRVVCTPCLPPSTAGTTPSKRARHLPAPAPPPGSTVVRCASGGVLTLPPGMA